MSRTPTIPIDWKDLIDAVGSIADVCDSLGLSQTAFYRASRGQVRFSPAKLDALEALCNLYDVKNPLETQPPPRAKDLSQLRMMGVALANGFPIAPKEIERLRSIYPDSQLLQLAESDNTPENILRAVTRLLEG